MSLEKENQTERHLALYSSIEKQLIPQLSKTEQETISSHIQKSTKKRKTVWIVVSSFLVSILVLAAAFQYLPLTQLTPYKPTTIYTNFSKYIVSKANEMTTIVDYDKCRSLSGLLVNENPRYCVYDGKRYFEATVTTKVLAQTPNSRYPTPIRFKEMSLFSSAQTGEKQIQALSGFSSDVSEFASQMRIVQLNTLPVTQKTNLESASAGTTPLSSALSTFQLEPLEFTNYVTLLDSVDEILNATVMYPEYTLKTGLFVSPTLDAPQNIQIMVFGLGKEHSFVLHQQLNKSVTEAFTQQLLKKCSTLQEEAKINCSLGILKDKSIKEKLQKDLQELSRYFAFSY